MNRRAEYSAALATTAIALATAVCPSLAPQTAGASGPSSAGVLAVASAGYSPKGAPTTNGTVELLSAATGSRRATVPVAGLPVSMALNPGGQKLYELGAGSDVVGQHSTLTAVNIVTGHAGAPIAVGSAPVALALAPTGQEAYVLDGYDAATQKPGGSLYRVNTVAGTAAAPLKLAQPPTAMALTPNGKTVYIVSGTAVLPVNAANGVAGPRVKVNATAISMAPNSATAYLVVSGNLQVVPLHTADQRLGTPMGTGHDVPEAVAVSPNSQVVAIVGAPDVAMGPGPTDDMAMLFDAANSHLDKSVKLGAYPKDPLWDIVFTPNGKTAFALGYGAPTSAGVLIAINVSAGTAASPLAVGVGASSLAVAPNGNEAYVLDAGSPPGAQAKTSAGSIVPIDVATDKTGPPIAVTAYAQVMAVS